MIIGKKLSRPELAVEAITVEFDQSAVAESAAKPFNFEVTCVTYTDLNMSLSPLLVSEN